MPSLAQSVLMLAATTAARLTALSTTVPEAGSSLAALQLLLSRLTWLQLRDLHGAVNMQPLNIALAALPMLTHLDVQFSAYADHSEQRHEFPSGATGCRALTTLEFSGENYLRFAALPTQFGSLSKLQFVSLRRCRVSIPPWRVTEAIVMATQQYLRAADACRSPQYFLLSLAACCRSAACQTASAA